MTGDQEKYRRYLRIARHFGADDGTLEIWEMLREFGQEPQSNADTADHDRKIAVMDSVIRLSPGDDYAQLRRGLAYFAKGDDDLAMADMDVVLEQDPDCAAAYILRGILFGNRKQWDRLDADMSELIRLRPDDALAHYHRGQAHGNWTRWTQRWPTCARPSVSIQATPMPTASGAIAFCTKESMTELSRISTGPCGSTPRMRQPT